MPAPTTAALANAIRFLAIDAIVRAGEGHQGVPLGMAEIATALFTRHLKFDAADPTWPDRDRVVLSNGHGSMLLYALLHLSGYARMGIEQVSTFRDFGSHCEGHPERDPASGIEVTTGPLGQGIGNAFGMAVAEAYLNARFGDGIVDHRTYAFVGDGCLQEGIGQEMISLAGHLRLGKLTLLWDDNRITDDGATDCRSAKTWPRVAAWRVGMWWKWTGTMSKPCPRPWMRPSSTRGLRCWPAAPSSHAASHACKASAAATVPGCLRRRRRGGARATGLAACALCGAGRCAGRLARSRPHRHHAERTAWAARKAALPAAQRAEFERIQAGELPEGWRELLAGYKRSAPQREALPSGIFISAEINDALVDLMPERMVACADLEAPTNHKRRLAGFSAQDRRGAYLHCGVREHVMGAMANGLAAHGGIVPLAVTYLAFADYERPAMRMAALMGLPVKFVFSHDSIGIGRNGPTHQPVEILASLRAMPNMLVLRPADAVEAAECWELAFEHRSGPATLVFARQALPHVRREPAAANLSRRGAYVLADAEGGPRQVTLLATGSEVLLALAAREALQAQGTPHCSGLDAVLGTLRGARRCLPGQRAGPRHRARGLRSGPALRLGPLAG
jgi:transketolase